jgi:hypothetical protein
MKCGQFPDWELLGSQEGFYVIELVSYCTNEGVKGETCISYNHACLYFAPYLSVSPRNINEFRLHMTRFYTKSYWKKKCEKVIAWETKACTVAPNNLWVISMELAS